MDKKKIIVALVIVLAAGGFAAKTFLLPKPAVAKQKVEGTIYVLPKGFTLNLSDGRYATMTLGLVLAPGQSDGASAATAGTTTPAGLGTLPEEAIVRAIVTNVVTDKTSNDLITAPGRAATERQILADIRKQTDVKVSQILLTDLAVQ